MVSDVRRKKLLFAFKKFFDADESGAVTKEDFEKTLEKLVRLQGWKETDVIFSVAKEIMNQIWDGFKAADVDSDGQVSTDEWIKMWDLQDKDTLPEWNNLFCKVCFHIQDKTGDGAIDEEEFVKVHEIFGGPKEDAVDAFKKMAGDKSSLNFDEFSKLFKEFFLSDDADAPGNYIFGTIKFLNE
ncbi:unnamed protein product [Pieris macdunnoughi]|uniref:EF-hand domain-containing protein n=1 Tax=Pieris macdunnoughi TaxID=345717 RepID=A0A821TRJ2_9NEOP|nr:unnamed protein product [Pieris macdunnoughi]